MGPPGHFLRDQPTLIFCVEALGQFPARRVLTPPYCLQLLGTSEAPTVHAGSSPCWARPLPGLSLRLHPRVGGASRGLPARPRPAASSRLCHAPIRAGRYQRLRLLRRAADAATPRMGGASQSTTSQAPPPWRTVDSRPTPYVVGAALGTVNGAPPPCGELPATALSSVGGDCRQRDPASAVSCPPCHAPTGRGLAAKPRLCG